MGVRPSVWVKSIHEKGERHLTQLLMSPLASYSNIKFHFSLWFWSALSVTIVQEETLFIHTSTSTWKQQMNEWYVIIRHSTDDSLTLQPYRGNAFNLLLQRLSHVDKGIVHLSIFCGMYQQLEIKIRDENLSQGDGTEAMSGRKSIHFYGKAGIAHFMLPQA